MHNDSVLIIIVASKPTRSDNGVDMSTGSDQASSSFFPVMNFSTLITGTELLRIVVIRAMRTDVSMNTRKMLRTPP
ncbi:hypothetical protein A311_00834 [Escherichia coli KTE146]|nr:hypothetical protein A311_00834 [Escherichia coli KTE146]